MRNKINLKNANNGITLIALIITVIVLLILAGVSINMIFGQEGIFNKTQTVADRYNKAEAEEVINLKLANINMTYYSDYQRKATLQEIADNLCTDKEVEYLNAGKLIGALEPIDLTGYSSFFVKLKAYVYEFEIGDDIQIASINVSGEPEIDATGRETPEQVIAGPKVGGAYNNPYIPTGFTHTVGDGTWNSGYTIKETATGNEFVWVPCIVKDGEDGNTIETMENGDKVITYGKTLTNKYSTSGENMTEPFTSVELVKTSVGKYGGFYIAKYEAGVPLENGVELNSSTITDFTKKARSVSNAKVWNNVSSVENAVTAAENMIDFEEAGVYSCLTSGSCWDTTLKWMVDTSDNHGFEPNYNYDIDSSAKGVYYTNVQANFPYATGITNVINNIYNMAGHVAEWTTEIVEYQQDYYHRLTTNILRGGAMMNAGNQYPAATRLFNGQVADSYRGFRVVLYK